MKVNEIKLDNLKVGDIISLEGTDVLDARIVSGLLPDVNEASYWRMSVANNVFAIREDVQKAASVGNIAKLNLQVTEQVVQLQNDAEGNPTGPETKVRRLSYAGHVTYDQVIGVETNLGKLDGIRLRSKIEAANISKVFTDALGEEVAEEVA